MTPAHTNRLRGATRATGTRAQSVSQSGALTPAQPIALARRPRGIVLAGLSSRDFELKFHCYMPKTTTWQEAKPSSHTCTSA